jgi:hypothetical protein
LIAAYLGVPGGPKLSFVAQGRRRETKISPKSQDNFFIIDIWDENPVIFVMAVNNNIESDNDDDVEQHYFLIPRSRRRKRAAAADDNNNGGGNNVANRHGGDFFFSVSGECLRSPSQSLE